MIWFLGGMQAELPLMLNLVHDLPPPPPGGPKGERQIPKLRLAPHTCMMVQHQQQCWVLFSTYHKDTGTLYLILREFHGDTQAAKLGLQMTH